MNSKVISLSEIQASDDKNKLNVNSDDLTLTYEHIVCG